MKGAAALTAATASARFGISPALAADASDWVWNPMRWVQVNFTEDDPGRFDPRFWLDFMRRTNTQGVCLSAGGIVAFYPTKVPFHYRSPYLGSSDPFGDMAKACKAMGLRVLARVDPSVMRADAVAAHPDWVARTASGEPQVHPHNSSMFLSCPDGPASFEWMPDVIREIMSTYPVDGIFGNRWSGGFVGICYCDISRAKFRAFSGFDLPKNPRDLKDPAVRAYRQWNDDMRFEQMKVYNETAQSVRPGGLFAPGSSWQRMDPIRLRETFRTIYADQQHRPAHNPVWASGRGAKEALAVLQGQGPAAGSFNVAHIEFKDSVQPIDETLTFMHDGMAQGFRPWLIKFKAEVFDKRWVPGVEAAFKWHSRHEPYFRNTDNLAKVAMMQSVQTSTFYSSGGRPSMEPVTAMTAGGNEPALNGAYQGLLEARVPFSLVDDRELSQDVLGQYKAIVLPNIAVMSDKQAASIREYVSNGGAIVATGETSLYDEEGVQRKNFALADLFGTDYAGKVDKDVVNSYISIEGPHPLTVGLDDTPRIVGGTRYVQATPRASEARPPLRLIRSYPTLPAETAYPREPVSNVPLAYAQSFGKGRVVYFPFNLDEAIWENSAEDHLVLLRNAVAWAIGEPQPMTVSGAGLVDVSYWRQEKSLAAHLVNLNNPSTMHGSMHETVPTGPFVVSLELPAGARPRRVRLLEAERDAKTRREGNRLIVDVPRLQLHEVIAIDLA